MKPLKEALEQLKQNPGDAQATAQAAAALLSQTVLAPAIWDKEPTTNEKGQMVFPEGTNVQLMILQKEDGTSWFPFFTSEKASRDMNPDMRCLVLSYPQMMQFVRMAGAQVSGAIFDPGIIDLGLDREFLHKLEGMQDKHMSVNQLHRGDKVTVRLPGPEGEDLAQALRKTAAAMPEVLSLHLLMRMMPDKSEHWLVVAGTEPEDPELFRKLARSAGKAAKGKDLEFLFDSSSVGHKISQAHTPIYKKSLN